MIFRLLVYGAVAYIVYRAVKSWTGQSTSKLNTGRGKPMPEIDDIMIKDPLCNVYFPKREGIHLRHKGKDIYFCSQKCKDEYISIYK